MEATKRQVSKDPQAIVALSRVAGLVTEFFDLANPVSYETPFVWWDRSKRNKDIALPMPEPIAYIGEDFGAWKRAPLFYQEQIIQWYGQWRGLKVRECQEAGDSVRGGRFTPSVYRMKL